MQINSVSYGYNTNFNAIGRSHLTDGSTALATVVHNKSGNISQLSVQILKDRKSLNEFSHEWPKGIKFDKFLQSNWAEKIYKELGITAEEDKEHIGDAIYDAQMNEISGGEWENPDGACLNDAFPEDSYPEHYPANGRHYSDFA